MSSALGGNAPCVDDNTSALSTNRPWPPPPPEQGIANFSREQHSSGAPDPYNGYHERYQSGGGLASGQGGDRMQQQDAMLSATRPAGPSTRRDYDYQVRYILSYE